MVNRYAAHRCVPPDYAEYNWQLSGTSLTDMEFRNQLGSFMSYCIRYDRQPTVLAYGTVVYYAQ